MIERLSPSPCYLALEIRFLLGLPWSRASFHTVRDIRLDDELNICISIETLESVSCRQARLDLQIF